MRKFDVNCFVGQWPFHSTRNPSCADIVAAHETVGIGGGLITTVQSIFFADPLTAAAALSKELPPGYGQVFSINPMLPAAGEICEEAIETYKVKGIRLVPTYHQFDWSGKQVQAVFDVAEKKQIPLFITARMEDHRLDYLLIQQPSPTTALSGALYDLPDVPVILTNISAGELGNLSDPILRRNDTFAEISFFTNPATAFENAVKLIGSERLMFGSAFNRLALGTAVANMKYINLTEEQKEDIWYNNAARIFDLI